MKPSDFYFCVDRNDPFISAFCFTSKEYWEENSTLDDQCCDIECLPDGFHNLMEACWEYVGSVEEGTQKLLDAGFEISYDMDDWINKYGQKE